MVLMGARASKTSIMEDEIVCFKVSIGLIVGESAFIACTPVIALWWCSRNLRERVEFTTNMSTLFS